ncbi:DUF3375 domain-containing protein [Blastopirellula marina]|uniref:DUF3375 domain-containing protein n=1 Tax=Blastopirellula marina DSM 3645 TaxID=314230 RepID=A3ZZ19_9BACT|nr:DUF3375 domain-containing protein [Blastopirellula marina]EAQ78157.1 hypothetical protein DSM3645_15310 [Blastopirellula marina DSM 3645]
MIRLGKLLVYFETSPAVSLLQSRNAPFVIGFLDQQFKQSGQIVIPHSDLISALVLFLDELKETHPDRMTAKPDAYLADWCDPEKRWLQRFLEADREEPVYQLTTHTEEVLLFVDRAINLDLGFVGTESRLKLVIETLSDLVVGSSDDPETRLIHLRKERDRIVREIEQIEQDGQISKYQPAQIRERFATAVSLLRQLQGDFRAVEDSFREITSQVQKREQEGLERRGAILEFALDSEDLLKQEDQGVSFYEFVKLILSPSQTERLEKVIQEVRCIPELYSLHEGLETVRNMITLLQNEAEKVMRTNQRLSATLRRLLDARAFADRRRIAQLLQEIQSLAITYEGNSRDQAPGVSFDFALDIDSPFRRSFWVEPPQFETIDLTNFLPSSEERREVFHEFASLQHLDWRRMRDCIRHLLATEHSATLGQLLAVHPISAGVVEVIGYLQLANEDGHLIDPTEDEVIHVAAASPLDRSYQVTVPRITFLPSRSRRRAK